MRNDFSTRSPKAIVLSPRVKTFSYLSDRSLKPLSNMATSENRFRPRSGTCRTLSISRRSHFSPFHVDTLILPIPATGKMAPLPTRTPSDRSDGVYVENHSLRGIMCSVAPESDNQKSRSNTKFALNASPTKDALSKPCGSFSPLST